jgi:hypothetical protein
MLFTSHVRSYHEIATEPNFHYGLRAGGVWLHDHVAQIRPDQVMVAGRGSPVYIRLIGGKPANTPSFVGRPESRWSLSDLVHAMREQNMPFLLLADKHIEGFPNLNALWQEPARAKDAGLELLHISANKEFIVFRLIDESVSHTQSALR